MKKLILGIFALVFCLSSFKGVAQGACSTDCMFGECSIKCAKGTYPSCSCIIGAFSSCKCRELVMTATFSDNFEAPALRNEKKLDIAIEYLKTNGLEDYSKLFSNLKTAMVESNGKEYYKNYDELVELVQSDKERAKTVEDYITGLR